MACRAGDESSWEVLVDRYQRLIYAIPRRAGLNEDQASEVFQEVFTTLLQKLNDITEPDRLHAWLVTTARRKTWRLMSKERLLHARDEERDEELTAAVDNAPLPDDDLVRLHEPPDQRLVERLGKAGVGDGGGQSHSGKLVSGFQ